jgi:iron(III) transport system substrate-binding protein
MMFNKLTQWKVSLVCLLLAGTLLPSAALAEKPRATLDVIGPSEGMDAKTWEKHLIEGAKKEGKLIWYTNSGLDNVEGFVRDFEQLYPFLKLEYWRGKTRALNDKLLTEARAGVYKADVIKTSAGVLQPLIDANLLAPYNPPVRSLYPADLKGRYWTSLMTALRVFGYNTDMVSDQDAPRSWEDLLDPKWKGKIMWDVSSQPEVLTLLLRWGEEKTENYFKQFVKNEPQIRRGRTVIAQLVAAGELPLAITIYAYNAEELRKQGAGLNWLAQDLTTGLIYPISLAQNAPHPYAAALFYDYLLSKRGQELRVKQGRMVALPGVKPEYERIGVLEGDKRIVYISPENATPLMKTAQRIEDQYLLKGRGGGKRKK